jgi:hypothetical protein
LKATNIDLELVDIRLYSVKSKDGQEMTRSLEIIDLAIQMIELASKRGPVKQVVDEVLNEAA